MKRSASISHSLSVERLDTYDIRKDNCREGCTYEAFHGLLRRQLDQLCAAEKHAPDVGGDVIDNNQTGGKPEPDDTLMIRTSQSARDA